MKQPDEFKIPSAAFPDSTRISEGIAELQQAINGAAKGSIGLSLEMSGVYKALADIANNAWKAKTKMVDPTSGEVREEMKRVYRHIEGVLETLLAMGLEVKDHTGDAFDYGLPLKVVTTQPTAGISRESVTETIKPTIYLQRQIIQMGEVVIATPASTETKE